MGKMISGSILILTAGFFYISRFIVTAIVHSGLDISGEGIFRNIMEDYSYSDSFLIISIALAIIGLILLAWGH